MYIIHCKKDIKSIYAFIPQNAFWLMSWPKLWITKIEKDIKKTGGRKTLLPVAN